jgi:thymidine phosphorylase
MGQSDEIAPWTAGCTRSARDRDRGKHSLMRQHHSKKLAEDDRARPRRKTWLGSFLPDVDAGSRSRTSGRAGGAHELPVVALVTAMDRPLGRACGNALEVEEALHALRGEGPPDVMRVTYALGAEMLMLAGSATTREAAHRMMEVSISSGRAAEKFQEIVEAQGGDPAVVDDPSRLPQSRECELFPSPRTGVIATIEPRAIGRGITALGGGRTSMEDDIDHSVGFVIGARPGDYVRQGEPLATIFARDAPVCRRNGGVGRGHPRGGRSRSAAAAHLASRERHWCGAIC